MILDQNYITLKTQVIKAERRILKELGFCVHIKHPHKIIVMYLQVLSFEKHKNLMQLSWNYMNDSLRTDVFVRYQPEVIAAACIYLTARKLKLPLPKSPAWYLLFGVKELEIKDVCIRILRLYNRPKPNVEILEKKVEELCKQYQDAKLKARGGSENNTPSHSGSPSSPGQKISGGTHNAWGGFISRSGSHIVPTNEKPARSKSRSPSHSPVNKHHKRSKKHARSRSRSPTTRSHKKSHKRRASYSRSRSNSPHAKQSRKSGREKRHRSRSRSHERRSASYEKGEKYDKEKNDKYVDRHDRGDKYEKYNSKDDKYSEKGDRYLDSSEKYEKKDRYNDKNDKNGDKNDKYSDKYAKDDKYARDDREKERYKKSKHRDEDRNEIRERSKDRRR